MVTYTHPLASNLLTKALVARRLQTNCITITYIHSKKLIINLSLGSLIRLASEFIGGFFFLCKTIPRLFGSKQPWISNFNSNGFSSLVGSVQIPKY